MKYVAAAYVLVYHTNIYIPLNIFRLRKRKRVSHEGQRGVARARRSGKRNLSTVSKVSDQTLGQDGTWAFNDLRGQGPGQAPPPQREQQEEEEKFKSTREYIERTREDRAKRGHNR